jgi:tRNA (guanine37-N1)-methyltransferase
MFSGIAPFGIAIAKKQPEVEKVYCIELNKDASVYAENSIGMNKLSHKVVPICGDVRKEAGWLKGKCDRVVMPLPKDAHRFLPEALAGLKPSGGVVHLYHVEHGNEVFTESVKLVKEACKKAGLKCRVLDKRKVLLYGPRVWKVCIDFKASRE